MVIYIPLLNRSRDCWRPVMAAHVRGDLYRILETKPRDERWQFDPGDVVYCERRCFPDDFESLMAVWPSNPNPALNRIWRDILSTWSR